MADEDPDTQLNALKKTGAKCIHREKTFYPKGRPRLNILIKRIKYGDTFIIWKLSRIGYSFKDMTGKITTLLKTGSSY